MDPSAFVWASGLGDQPSSIWASGTCVIRLLGSQTVEGAALFSHALSTHAVRSELDFFSAVDDEKKNADNSDDAGAGQLGDIEYNSACYYRYMEAFAQGFSKLTISDKNEKND